MTKKKLIEVALPLEAINKASACEKMPDIGVTSVNRLWEEWYLLKEALINHRFCEPMELRH